jgi:hypothetical protein
MAKAAFDSCKVVLDSMRKILDDDTIDYRTDVRAKYQWINANFKGLADDLPPYFKAAKHPIPNPINRNDLATTSTVREICGPVVDAFKKKG